MAEPGTLEQLVARWVQAWALCRDSPWRRAGDGSWHVEVRGSEHRSLEVFLVSPDPEALGRALARLPGTPGLWITVLTPRHLDADLPDGVVVHEDGEFLMRTTLTRPPRVDPRVVLSHDAPAGHPGRRVRASLLIGDEQVAEGTLGVVGTTAVLDRIATSTAHRRQGLGSAVVGALSAAALDLGATRGLLAASADGRALYSRLGWDDAAALVTLVARAPG